MAYARIETGLEFCEDLFSPTPLRQAGTASPAFSLLFGEPLLLAFSRYQVREQEGAAMKTQVIIMDRRQHRREGVLAEIENVTYTVLRKYGINGPT